METSSALQLSRPVLALVLAAAIWASVNLAGGSMGNHCEQAGCAIGIRSSAGSTIIGVAMILLLAAWRPRTTLVATDSRVGIWRRAGAFLVDFAVVLVGLGPISLLPLLLQEAVETGYFHWSFERTVQRPSDDILGLLSGFSLFIGLYLYDYWCTSRHQSTFGSYIFGYRLAPAPGSKGQPIWASRPLLSFIGLCWWPLSVLFALTRADRDFWWDRETGTRAVRLARGTPHG